MNTRHTASHDYCYLRTDAPVTGGNPPAIFDLETGLVFRWLVERLKDRDQSGR